FEFSVPAGARVPVPHSHDAYEETIYGVEGVLTWTIEGDAHDVAAGEVLVIPRGAVHGFANPGSVDAKALAVVTPGLLGPEYFREVGEAVAAGNLPEVGAIMQRHGLTPAPQRSERIDAGQKPCLPGERMPFGSTASLIVSTNR